MLFLVTVEENLLVKSSVFSGQMNAIVSLCHFCELHGPSVVFCTQTFRDQLGFNIIAGIETSELESPRNVQDEEETKVLEATIQ